MAHLAGDLFNVGVDANGKPFPVHATAAPEYGAGALLGLVAGATRRDALLEVCGALTASLMERGKVDVADLAARYRRIPNARSAPLPLVVVPLALFYAGQPHELTHGVLVHTRLIGGDAATTLAALTLASAISAGVYELESPYDMSVAAVLALDASVAQVSGHLGGVPAAHVRLREDLRAAVTATTCPAVDDGATNELSFAVRRAFWHLLHSDDPQAAMCEVGARGDTLGTALTGVLLGAAHGAGAFGTWRDALAQQAAPLLAILHEDDDEPEDEEPEEA